MSRFDVLITGGIVVDGTRHPRYRADVAIKDGVIAKIGQSIGVDAEQVIDADGLLVVPGFIDLHTHYDSQVFWDPYCSTSSWHGVTSVVIGNCGFGFAPVRPEERERSMLTMTRNEAVPLACMQEGMPWDWVTFPEFLSSLERTPKSVNVLALVPLNPLMVWTMGLERAKSGALPTDAEHAEMCRLLDEAMDAGASGVSAQRMGPNSLQRDHDGTPMATDLMHDETMLVLAEVLGRRNEGIVQYTYAVIGEGSETVDVDGAIVHIQDDALAHIEEVARVSGRPVIVGGGGEADLDWVRACQERGLRIYAMDPLNQSASVSVALGDAAQMFDISLEWCQATVGTTEEIIANFSDAGTRATLRAALPKLEGLFGPIGEWVLMRAATPAFATFDQTSLAHVAAALGYDDCLDAFLDINVAEDLMTKWYLVVAFRADDPASLELVERRQQAKVADPYAIPGISDGGAHTKFQNNGHYPTYYLMTYVREHGWHSVEDAHWRLSGLPAFAAGFKDRGTLVEGAPADIVVYDLAELDITELEPAYDYPANEWRLVDHAAGYHYILVNGEVVMDHGAQTDVHPGRLLRHGRAAVADRS